MRGSILGTEVRRVEDADLVRGQGTYVDNLDVPSALHLSFVRSPIAHARIENVDVSQARSAPGVRAVYTSESLSLPPQVGLVRDGTGTVALVAGLDQSGTRHAGGPITGNPGGPMTMAKLGSSRSHARGERHLLGSTESRQGVSSVADDLASWMLEPSVCASGSNEV